MKLNPCPYCNGLKLKIIISLPIPYRIQYSALCLNIECLAQGPINEDRLKAIELWNSLSTNRH